MTIDRPERRNAMSFGVMEGLRESVAAAKADDAVRVLVLTGAGEKAFCAGADLGSGGIADGASAAHEGRGVLAEVFRDYADVILQRAASDACVVMAMAAPDDGAQTRFQLDQCKRLAQYVVGALVETGHPFGHRIAATQHQHRNLDVGAVICAALRDDVEQRDVLGEAKDARRSSPETGTEFVPFDQVREYDRYVDGKPRLDGTRSFLRSRGIELPEGSPDDPPGAHTVHGLSTRVETTVAIELAASWMPLEKSNARARATSTRTMIGKAK